MTVVEMGLVWFGRGGRQFGGGFNGGRVLAQARWL